MKNPVKHVDFLDHIRGIAILAVLFFHTLGNVYGYDALPWNGWFRDFSVPVSFLCFLPFSFAQAGVPIFFVVSGFCIHMSFQQQGQRYGSFFLRRFFRIYPPYLAALFFSVLLIMARSGLDFHTQAVWTQLLTHSFLVHNYSPDTFSGLNASFWSLAVEAQLYLLYPALLALVARFDWRRTMIFLAGCELLIRGLDGLIQTVGATGTLWGHISWLFTGSPLGYWFSWALGAFIADAFLKKRPLPFIKASPIWWIVLVVVCYFVKPLNSFRFLLFAVITAIFVSKLLAGVRPKYNIPAFWSGILKNIGLWSYSIYLLHQPLIHVYSYVIAGVVPEEFRPAPIMFLLIVVAWLPVIPFGFLWYEIVELPSITLGKRFIQKLDARNDSGAGQPCLQPRPVAVVRANRVTKSRYCLMIGVLLVVTVENFLVSAKFSPRPVPENNYLAQLHNHRAWLLATDPEAARRNGALAVKFAEDACKRTHYQETVMVETLAAAYAEAGRFEEAASTAQKACDMISRTGDKKLLQKNEELLALYLNHQPYHERQTNTIK